MDDWEDLEYDQVEEPFNPITEIYDTERVVDYFYEEYEEMTEKYSPEDSNFRGLKKFKKQTKYPHNRSEGMSRRKNKGSQFQGEGNG